MKHFNPVGLFVAVLAVPTFAQDQEALQKQLSNPVADLITLPFQYTGTAHVGPDDAWQHTLNFQPVYPVKLNSDWNLINRAIVPILSNPGAPGQDRTNGIGDITYEAFFTPALCASHPSLVYRSIVFHIEFCTHWIHARKAAARLPAMG